MPTATKDTTGRALQTKPRPILMKADSVRSILRGEKAQTRRVVKPQPEKLPGGWLYEGEHFGSGCAMKSHLFHNVYGERGSPYGADVLWVRETFSGEGYDFSAEADRYWHEMPARMRTPSVITHLYYRATQTRRFVHTEQGYQEGRCEYPELVNAEDIPPADLKAVKWSSPLFMPRWCSRLILRITDVRAERLQEIDYLGIRAEGFEPQGMEYLDPGKAAKIWFESRWNAINAERGFPWTANPWVWVITFEVASCTGLDGIRKAEDPPSESVCGVQE